MRRYALMMLFMLSFHMCFSIHLESVGITGDFVVIKIMSDHRVSFFKFADKIYPAEFVDVWNGKYIYSLKIPLNEIRMRSLKVVAYEIPPLNEEITVELPKIEKLERFKIPATLVVIGSDSFKDLVLKYIGDEFSKIVFDTQGEVSKYAVVFVENVDPEKFPSLLSEFSEKFLFYSLVGFSAPSKPVVFDLSKLPKNCSFVILEKPMELEKFLKNIENADIDDDGWIEVEEIAKLNEVVIYDGRMKIPVVRNRIFPLLDRNLVLQKVSTLVMEGLLEPSDVQPCLEDIEKSIAPPWLTEYVLGKTDVANLRNLPRFLW